MAYSITVDLHGETVDSARRILTQRLKSLGKDTREVVVIHGYHGGTALLSMVRSFKHPKLERKIVGLNNGETVFIIKI